MSTFTVKLSRYTEVEVTMNKHTIDIRSQDAYDLSEALDAVDDQLQAELREHYPIDYALILAEDYGSFLALGSPQFMECGWKLDYHTEAYLTSITISNMK